MEPGPRVTFDGSGDAYATALQLGSREVHAPQEWPQYPPPYFASFWLDPCGIMLEAVCHYDR
jgi:hypothetical protein